MNTDSKRNKKNSKHFLIAVSSIAVMFLVLIFSSKIYIDYLEFSEIGADFVSVYIKNFTTDLLIFSMCFLITFFMLHFNSLFVKRVLTNEGISNKFLKKISYSLLINAVLSIVVSFVMYKPLADKFLLCFNGFSFNRVEEITGFDLSFFFFVKPFVDISLEIIAVLLIIILIYVFINYFLMYVDLSHRNLNDLIKNKKILNHLLVCLTSIMIVLSLIVWMKSIDIVYSGFAGLDGAGFVDVVLTQNFLRILSIVIFACSVLILLGRQKKIKLFMISSLIIITVFLLGVFAQFCIQSFYVSPNEVMVEYPYIDNNIKATRFGYNIEKVIETEYHVDNTVTKNNFNDNSIIDNTRIIDYNSSVVATNQLQAMRNYYKFSDIDVALYDINGNEELVAVGIRELDKSSIEDSAKNYTNEKLKFTHGYGAVMMATNKVTSQGEPYFYIKDMNLYNETGENVILQPRIYYGEMQNDYSIVNTNTSELDYSEGSVDHVFSYDGNSGIRLNMINRILYSIIKTDYKMLVTNQIHSGSKLLINTNVIERVQKVAPFLKFDADPQAIIVNNGIKWVINAYTHSDLLPYSAKNDGVNYIRNSVKVTVDAYDGTVKFYIIDKTDPIINTYNKIYPGLFEKTDIPDDIMEKSAYPEWLFSLQSKVYALYHSNEPATFYNKSDMYAIPNEKYNKDIRPMQPYYNYLRLEEFNKNSEEMILMLPYTMYNRDNMISWIAVGNSPANYGKIVAYKFPKNLNIYGPLQIENLIDNDPEISKELTLWNNGEGSTIRGNLLVIPVNETILYIEPVYLNSENQAALPVLQRVIVAVGDRIAMDTNIRNALSKVLATDVVYSIKEDNVDTDTIYYNEDIIKSVIDSYYEVEKNASEGNWTEFGNAMDNMKNNISILENSIK